jgi:hypothetical protein
LEDSVIVPAPAGRTFDAGAITEICAAGDIDRSYETFDVWVNSVHPVATSLYSGASDCVYRTVDDATHDISPFISGASSFTFDGERDASVNVHECPGTPLKIKICYDVSSAPSTATPTSTSAPTDTPTPTSTATPPATDTPPPTATATPVPGCAPGETEVLIDGFSSDGDTQARTVYAPAGEVFTSGTISTLHAAGDLDSSDEYVELSVEDHPINGRYSTGHQDCVLRQVDANVGITSFMGGQTAFQIEAESSPGTDRGTFACPATAVKLRLCLDLSTALLPSTDTPTPTDTPTHTPSPTVPPSSTPTQTPTPSPTSTPSPTPTPTTPPVTDVTLTRDYAYLVCYGPLYWGLPAQTLHVAVNGGSPPHDATFSIVAPSGAYSLLPYTAGSSTFSYGPLQVGNPYFGVDETGTWQAWVVVEGILSNVVTWETRCYRVHRSR